MKTITFSFLVLILFGFAPLFSQVTISVDLDERYQSIIGFGGHNPNGQVDMLVNDMGMSIQRCWLDPAFEPSNDNGDPNTANTSNFDFNNATTTSVSDLIALKNAGVKYFMATPWSPPAWMKDNNSTIDGGHVRTAYYDELVEFFVQFIKDFETNIGIPLYAVSIQNEPRFAQFFMSCEYTPEEMRDVVKLLGARLDEESLDTKIIVAEDMGSNIHFTPWFNTIVVNDYEARQATDIFAVHGYQDGVNASGDANGWVTMYDQCEIYDIPLWMTETSGYNVLEWEEGYINVGDESGVKPGSIDLAKHIYWALKYGKISAWVWWRININSGQTSFWIDECLSHGSTKTKAYYASKQFYKYIKPGAVHVETTSPDDEIGSIAFSNPDEGEVTLVLLNFASSQKTVELNFGSGTAPGTYDVYRSSSSEDCEFISTVTNNSFTLPARSVSTLIFAGANKAPTLEKPENSTILSSAGQQTINLSGITDGGEGGQTISISATSSNTSIIPHPSISYSSPSASGSLSYDPVIGSSGTTTISIIIEDNGDATGGLNKRIVNFDVKVIPFVNDAPTLEAVNSFDAYIDDGQKMVELTGLSDGNDGSQSITVEVEAAVPQALNLAAVVNNNVIELYYIPILEGSIPVTLTIKDNGGVELGGSDTKTVTFNINVIAGSDPNIEPTSINNNSKKTKPVLFPNPTASNINVINVSNKYSAIDILDISGKIVYSQFIDDNTNSMIIDLKSFHKGIYCMRISGKNTLFTEIFIKE